MTNKTTLSSLTSRARRRAKALSQLKNEDNNRALKADAGPCHLPVIYGNDTFFLTRDEAWTAVRVPNKTRGFLPERTRRSYFSAVQRFYSRDMPSEKENHGQLLVTNRVVTMDEWEAQILDPDSPYNPAGLTSGYQAYVRGSRKAIDNADFSEVTCYLLTCLGKRGQQGLVGMADKAVDLVMAGAGMDDSQPDADEIAFWQPQANGVRRTLAGSWLAGEPVPRRELEWLIRHQDTPGLPTVDVSPSDAQEWGAGAWRTALSSYTEEVALGVRNKKRYTGIKVDGPTGAGTTYAAFLPVAVIPPAIRYDSHWLNYAAGVDFPVDISVHFEVLPAARVEKDLDKVIETADIQQAEAEEVGMSDTTTATQRASLDQARVDVMMNRSPMMRWQAVMSVYAPTPDLLLDRIEALIQHYGALQIELKCPPLDQRPLYFQAFPGAPIILDDWMHRTDTAFLASSQPWLDQRVGNSVDVPGDYQGFTLEVDSSGNLQRGVPFFYNLFSVVDGQGKAPTEGVIASPGAGKRLPLDTPVLAADGTFTTIGHIREGDRIWGVHGPVTVTSLSPVKEDATGIRLVFDDGTALTCDPEHRITLYGPDAKDPTWDLPATGDAPTDRLITIMAGADPDDTTTPPLLCRAAGDVSREADYTQAARVLEANPVGEYWTRDLAEQVLASRGVNTAALPVTLTAAEGAALLAEGKTLTLPLADPIEVPDPIEGDWRALAAAIRDGDATADDISAAYTWTIQARTNLLRYLLDAGTLTAPLPITSALAGLAAATGIGTHHTAEAIWATGRTHRTLVGAERAECTPMRCLTVDAPDHLYLAGPHHHPTHNTVSRGLKPVYEDALRGVTQYVWDPKGDFLPLYHHAKDLMLDPDKVKLIDLGDPQVSISLDAFSVAEYDPEAQIDGREASAREVLRLLAQEMVSSDNPDANIYRSVIDQAVAAVMRTAETTGTQPTMAQVLSLMRSWGSADASTLPEFRRQARQDAFIDAAEELSRQYAAINRDSMGRLLFLDPTQGGALSVEEGVLTIFVAMKLKTTGPGEEQTPTTVVGDTIAAMMVDYIRSLLSRLPVKVQKAASFDEWHVIKRTKRADALVDWMRRMGRSRRCAVRQMSQSANDLSASSLACVWAGWATEESEARASCKLLGIEETQANIEMIMGLSKGEFIFRDGFKRYARVFVDFWDPSMLRLFNTEAISKAED